MRIYGLIGYPLSHSFSQQYFRNKFEKENITDCDYQLFPIESIEELPDLLYVNSDCCGLNVTIPHKESVLEHLNVVDDTALAVGAVNTIVVVDGELVGYNTDVLGFQQSLEPLLEDHHKKGALILGTGGASKAVKYVLDEWNIPNQLVSRNKRAGIVEYAELDETILKQHPLIINTTPLGMFPLQDEAPALNYEHIGPKHLLFDLIYNPEKTQFLLHGAARGARIKNGYEMLEIQAEESWKIWTT